MVIKSAESEGTSRVCERVGLVLDDIIGEAVMEGGRKSSNRLERRMKAEKKRLELMKHLESWWPTLEGGMPELETEMESHPEQEGLAKRKINFF